MNLSLGGIHDKKSKKKVKYKIEHNFFYLPIGTQLICTKDFPCFKLFCGMHAVVIESLKNRYEIIEIPNQSVTSCEKLKKNCSTLYSCFILASNFFMTFLRPRIPTYYRIDTLSRVKFKLKKFPRYNTPAIKYTELSRKPRIIKQIPPEMVEKMRNDLENNKPDACFLLNVREKTCGSFCFSSKNTRLLT